MAARYGELRSPGRRSRSGRASNALVDARLPARGSVGGAARSASCSTFPDGRPWSRVAQIAIAGAYVATLGGQLVGAFVRSDTRDVPRSRAATRPSRTPSIERRRSPGSSSPWSCWSSWCGDCASCVGRHDARRDRCSSRRPSPRRAPSSALVGRLRPTQCSVDARDDRRAIAVSSPARASSRGSCGRGLRRPEAVRARRRTADEGLAAHARAARAGARRPDARGCVPARRRPLRRRDRAAGRAARQARTVPSRR